ncbi:TonB-dependent receptor domain-containing protein [Phytopseudomonas dryadis]|uniref:TonB-dependent receptor n=1 Tax=Phytopseudomonas dryadis TaxID=2487520 RepID=A0A4Q9R5S9_9GAMM|nr:TonB-dependent receptor [Pseudomonas dryadis]TBU95892.1 TonB-dependent receptor [Pseudomonas dryadis]
MKLPRLILASSLAPGLALAQVPGYDDALKLSETVISSNRDVQLREQSSTPSTVFTRADIERLQPGSVLDLLARVPGVQVTRSGGRGSNSGLYIRGTKSAQSLVLVDGQRIGSASAGISPLEYLNIEQIERVEVLRGSRSAIHGADAIGGVVQIFTRRATGEGLNPRLRIGYGTNHTWERSLGLSGGNADTRFNLGLSADDTRGINRTYARVAPDNDRDAYRNNAFSANLSHRFSDELEAGLSVLDQRGESEYDLGWDGAYPYADYQLTSYSGFLSARLLPNWKSRVELGHSENRSTERFDDTDGSSPFNTYRDSLAWLNMLDLGNGHSLLLGADGYQEQLNSHTDYAQDSRWNHAVLAQHSYHGERFSTELGLRHEKNQQFGSANTFSGALGYQLNARNELILSYAEGFRAPTFNDLYWPGGGNPDLQPETSKSYELQWRSQVTTRTALQASVYRTELRDAINGWPAENVDKARINGFEGSLQQQLFGWQAALGLSLIDPRDRTTGKQLNRRAKRTLSLDVDRQFGDWSFGATWQAVSRTYDDADNQREIAGHGLLGLRSSWQTTPELALGLKLDNLLDKRAGRAQYSYGDWPVTNYAEYREEGRTALLSLTWTPAL